MEQLIGAETWRILVEWAKTELGLSPDTTEDLVETALVLIITFSIHRIADWIYGRRIEDPARRYTASKTTGYVLGFVALVLVFRIWLRGIDDLATTVGIFSAGLAVALKDPIANFAGWIYIVIRKPFAVGDRIQIGEHAGDVVDLRLLNFSVIEIGNWVAADQSTGRLVHIPNGDVFRLHVANYTEGFEFIWNEVPVNVTFESDWRRAHAVLTEIGKEYAASNAEEIQRQLRRTTSKYLVFFRHITPIVWVSVAEFGIVLTLRYLCPVRQRRSSSSEIWKAILDAFEGENAVNFAYPTVRRYDNVIEGKPEARAQPLPTYKPKD